MFISFPDCKFEKAKDFPALTKLITKINVTLLARDAVPGDLVSIMDFYCAQKAVIGLEITAVRSLGFA
jgi:hypothetical protein